MSLEHFEEVVFGAVALVDDELEEFHEVLEVEEDEDKSLVVCPSHPLTTLTVQSISFMVLLQTTTTKF